MGIPRLARLLILSTLIITIPTLYFLYPHRESIIQTTQGYLEKGGIDSSHWRDPLPPGVEKYEDEETRDWEGQDVLHQNPQGGQGDVDVDIEIGATEVTLDTGGAMEHVDDMEITAPVLLDDGLTGGVIMPKLENATAKAELGRAAWKVLHLMTLRYPDEPKTSDREALKSFFHLFSRLYPCGECASEFQALLKEYPPQTSSRKSASLWLCHVHNLINERLGKPEFDCLTLDATYDCGCGPDGNATTSATSTTGSAVPTSGTVRGGAAILPHADWERNT